MVLVRGQQGGFDVQFDLRSINLNDLYANADQITFTDRSTGGTTRLWTIGTKTYTTQSVSDLVLAQEGTLSVSLTVTNSGGSSTLTQTYVVLADAPAVSFTAPATVDNFEGIAAVRRADGGVRLYILSDDNFNARQRTLLLAFDVRD